MRPSVVQLALTNDRPLVSCIKLLVARNPPKWKRVSDLLEVYPELQRSRNLVDEDPQSVAEAAGSEAGGQQGAAKSAKRRKVGAGSVK